MHDIGNAAVQHRLFMQLYAYPACFLITYCQVNRQICQLLRTLDFTDVLLPDCPEKTKWFDLEDTTYKKNIGWI